MLRVNGFTLKIFLITLKTRTPSSLAVAVKVGPLLKLSEHLLLLLHEKLEFFSKSLAAASVKSEESFILSIFESFSNSELDGLEK